MDAKQEGPGFVTAFFWSAVFCTVFWGALFAGIALAVRP